MKAALPVTVAAAGLMSATAALAHHSYAMFNTKKVVSAAAVIARFEWTNPHTYLWFYTPKQGGGYQLVGLEGPGPAELVRKGWTKESFKVGEKISVRYNPLLDGRPGGSFISATHADGSVSQSDAAPGAGAGAPPGDAP